MERLQIKYNQYEGVFELWRVIYVSDPLYPVWHQWHEYTAPTKLGCIAYAKNKFPKSSGSPY